MDLSCSRDSVGTFEALGELVAKVGTQPASKGNQHIEPNVVALGVETRAWIDVRCFFPVSWVLVSVVASIYI